jgi:hypothetical protein
MSYAVSARDYGSPHTQKFEYSGDSVIYIGKADPGTATSEAAWSIQKLTYDGSNHCTDIKWAQGKNAFEFIWDNRATYTYS